MDQNPKAEELRAKAVKYRALARAINDVETANRIFELAEELEQQARGPERHD
jgi:hypothetical protein